MLFTELKTQNNGIKRRETPVINLLCATDPWFLPYTSLTMEAEGTWDQSLLTVSINTRTRRESFGGGLF